MKKLIAIAMVLAVNTAMAAPGHPGLCGRLAKQAANAQELRQMNVPQYMNSADALTEMNRIIDEVMASKPDNPNNPRVIASMKKGALFIAKNMYIRSKSTPPEEVAEYINTLCLIDLD